MLNLRNFIILASSDTDSVSDIGLIADTGDRTSVGGGDILDFFNRANRESLQYMDNDLLNNFANIGLYKVILIILILIIFIILMFKLFGIRGVRKDAGIQAEIDNVKTLRKTERRILRNQKILTRLKTIVSAFGLDPDEVYKDYMNYNLKRAAIMAPSGDRPMDAYEFNALVVCGEVVTSIVCILIMLIWSLPLGFMALAISLVAWSTFPKSYVRAIALERDNVIKDNFFEFYQEIHYILKDGGKTPLAKRIRSYEKGVKDKPELIQFAETCADLFDLYGEAEGAKKAAKEFREIPDVTKLMRLIQQFNEGANIAHDLEGFRQTLLLKQQMRLEDEQKKLINKARASFNVLMIVLFQAILSAMAIYAQDLTNISNFM